MRDAFGTELDEGDYVMINSHITVSPGILTAKTKVNGSARVIEFMWKGVAYYKPSSLIKITEEDYLSWLRFREEEIENREEGLGILKVDMRLKEKSFLERVEEFFQKEIPTVFIRKRMTVEEIVNGEK